MSTLNIVRSIVGRRHKITRQEMADILTALAADGLHLGNDCMLSTWTLSDDGRPMGVSDDAPRIWANACKRITVISVMATGTTPHGQVRYDEPGSMAPTHHAELMFAPAGLNDYDYLRRHADRVLIVRDDPPLLSAAEIAETSTPPKVADWIARMRKHPDIDGKWMRLFDDGTLEMRDPNDGQSRDLREKIRYQFRVDDDGTVLRRRMPPECIGDEWADIGAPEWEPTTTPPARGVMYQWWEAQVA